MSTPANVIRPCTSPSIRLAVGGVLLVLAGCRSSASHKDITPVAQVTAAQATAAQPTAPPSVAPRPLPPAFDNSRVIPTVARMPVEAAPELIPTPTTAEPAPLPAPAPPVLSLEDAIVVALAENPRLRQAAAQSQVARADADVAFAPFLPTVGSGFRYAAFTEPVIPGGAFVPASLAGGAESFFLAEAGIQYTIADFGRRAGHYGQAVHRARSQELAQARANQTVAFEVSQAYFRLLAAQAVVRVCQEALRDAERILADTRARLEGGVVEREAVLRAEVELSEAKQRLLVAAQNVRDAHATLNVVMGRGPMTPLQIADVASRPAFQQSLEECLAIAIVDRREIGMARESVAEARHGVQEARGEFLPKVYVRGTAIQCDSPGPLNGSIEGIGLHVDQPLYAGGRYQGQVRASEAQVAAALAGLQGVIDNVSLQVTIAYQAIDTDRQRIELAETAVLQARENLRLTIVRYQNGNATPTDVVDAQTALVQNQTGYYTAVYGYLESLARLEYALGGGQQRLVEQTRPPWAGAGAPATEP